MSETLDRLREFRVIPVVTVDSAPDGDLIGEALVTGGLPVAEFTLRTPAALSALAAAARRDDLLVGAGTVVDPDQVDAAVAAGARFIVSPGTSARVLERCRAHGITVIPGASTASEVQAAREHGIRTVKFFPAETSGGVAAVRALAAPFGDVSFVPTGGIDARSARAYLDLPAVLAVGGSWMLPTAAIRRGDVDAVAAAVRETVMLSRPTLTAR